MFLCRDAILFRTACLFLAMVLFPAALFPKEKRPSGSHENHRGRKSAVRAALAGNPDERGGPTRYRVRRGDTLFSIARKYGTTVRDIEAVNRIPAKGILAGMTLKIPSGKVSAKTRPCSADTDGRVRTEKKPAAGRPAFSWPVKKVLSCERDGIDGGRAMGLIITAPAGAPVLSSAPGTVEKIGYMRGYGNFVLVKHADRYVTVYSRLECVSVRQGQHVGTGSLIGRLDSDGNTIHFQKDRQGKPVNPLEHLPSRS
jgi:lipoprotein NlpD